MKHWNDHSIVKSGSSAECHTFSVNRGLVNTYKKKNENKSAYIKDPEVMYIAEVVQEQARANS